MQFSSIFYRCCDSQICWGQLAGCGADRKDRGLVGDDSFSLSARTYMEPNDDFHPFVGLDYQDNSLTRANEDRLFINRVITEGKFYPSDQGFLNDYRDPLLAKRRRIDCDDWQFMNCATEDGLYKDRSSLHSLCTDAQEDSMDEVRRLVDDHWLLTVEREGNEKCVDKTLNTVLSTEYPVGLLDARIADEERFVQKNRLFKDFDMDSNLGKTFASVHHRNPLNRSRLSIYDDRFLTDDCVQREYNATNIFKPVLYRDDLYLLEQARKLTDDHQCSANVNWENRYHVDCDGSSSSASENPRSLLYELRKTTSGGRFPITKRIESEPNFSTCTAAGFSSEKLGKPLRYGFRTIHDEIIPTVEGKVTENSADTILYSTSLKKSGYISGVDGRVVDGGRSRKIDGVKNAEGIHGYASSVISTEYPSFSKTKQNLFSFCDKCSPETRLSQLITPQRSDPSRPTFDYETIAKACPHVPELPNIAHGCSSSLAVNQSSSLVKERLPYPSSIATHYSLSDNCSSRCLGVVPECGNNCLATNTLSPQSSLFYETTNSFLNSESYMHGDLNTSSPVGYRGSMFPSSICENIGGGKRRFPYKSSKNDSALDRNLPIASLRTREHVPWQKMDMLAGKDFHLAEANDISASVYHPERDLKSNKDQYLNISCYMNLKELKEIADASYSDSNTRRSVFTRLTSGQKIQVEEERNGNHFNCHNSYVDASADKGMEMLHKGKDMPPKKLRKFRMVGQPYRGETDLDERQIQSYNEVNSSPMEKKQHEDPYLAMTEDFGKVPKETRMVDFKRRSEIKKSLSGTRATSVAHNNITSVNGEVESSAKKVLKRKKLVRPVFRKNESATVGSVSNQNILLSEKILDKDDKQSCEKAIRTGEAKIPKDDTGLGNVLVLSRHQSVDCNVKENSNYKDQKDLGAHVLLSTHHEIEGKRASNVGLQTGSSQVLHEETSQHKPFGLASSTKDVLSRDIGTTVCGLNLLKSSSDGATLEAGCGSAREDKKTRLKSRKKIMKTCKTGH